MNCYGKICLLWKNTVTLHRFIGNLFINQKFILMNRLILVCLSVIFATAVDAQVLTLDSCRARALRTNKQVSVAKMKKEIAVNSRKAARTKYLPHIDVNGGYMYSSREISLLSDDRKAVLNGLGSLGVGAVMPEVQKMGGIISTDIGNGISAMEQLHIITPQMAGVLKAFANQLGGDFSAMGQQLAAKLAEVGNGIGQNITDAFKTDTHHMFTASAILTQPVYMGGAITAANKMASIAEQMAETTIEAKEKDITYSVDNAYWTVVSLRQKQRLAESYLELVEKLNADVHKMIDNGVATKADGLKVDVAVNEAEMTKTRVDNGLALARMFLCQQCGMPLDSNITLADENKDELSVEVVDDKYDLQQAMDNRSELKLLNNAILLSKQQTKMVRAGYLPQVAVMTGAVFSSPSVYNGFENKFKGSFNAGVMVRIPVLDWGETIYKVRSTKNATKIAQMQYDEAEELIELQINQSSFKVREANKNLAMAKRNIQRAEENLRCATLGFKEGVMQTTEVMAAQTAWLQAQSQKVDAQIELKMSEMSLKKAMGILN